jgi:hypothetical protein
MDKRRSPGGSYDYGSIGPLVEGEEPNGKRHIFAAKPHSTWDKKITVAPFLTGLVRMAMEPR